MPNMQGHDAFGDLVAVLQFAEEEQAVGAADREEGVAQGERMTSKAPALVGIAVEQQVIVQQQGLKSARHFAGLPPEAMVDSMRKGAPLASTGRSKRRYVTAEAEDRLRCSARR